MQTGPESSATHVEVGRFRGHDVWVAERLLEGKGIAFRTVDLPSSTPDPWNVGTGSLADLFLYPFYLAIRLSQRVGISRSEVEKIQRGLASIQVPREDYRRALSALERLLPPQ